MQVSVKAKPPECITAKNIKIGKDDRKMYASPAHAVLKKYHLFSLYVIFLFLYPQVHYRRYTFRTITFCSMCQASSTPVH